MLAALVIFTKPAFWAGCTNNIHADVIEGVLNRRLLHNGRACWHFAPANLVYEYIIHATIWLEGFHTKVMHG